MGKKTGRVIDACALKQLPDGSWVDPMTVTHIRGLSGDGHGIRLVYQVEGGGCSVVKYRTEEEMDRDRNALALARNNHIRNMARGKR